MTWDMKAQTWIERQVHFFCADEPFAEGAMRKAFYIKFERHDRLRGGDRMCVCVLAAICGCCHRRPFIRLTQISARFVAKLAKDQRSMFNVDQYERDVKMQVST
jgi:hypothetical protein